MSTKKIKYGVREADREYGPLTFAKILESHRLGEEMSQKDCQFGFHLTLLKISKS